MTSAWSSGKRGARLPTSEAGGFDPSEAVAMNGGLRLADPPYALSLLATGQ